MDELTRNSDQQEVIERLRNLPLEPVPEGLTATIMARIPSAKPSLINTIWSFISQPQSFSFRPVYAFTIALLVCGAFLLGKNSRQLPVQVASLVAPTPQIQPELLGNPESAYLVGRGLLRAQNSEDKALAFLRRASLLDPENPEFAYWEGVGHWANGDKNEERRSYLRGLRFDPNSVPLLINLGHNYLSDKSYDEALAAYQAALFLSPNDPVALYNSGLINRAIGDNSEEIAAWRSFLQDNRVGPKSFRAVQRLNEYEDFTFRTYRIGPQAVILNQQTLLDDSLPTEKQRDEVAVLSSILESNELLHLEVVVFVENDREAARKKAFDLKGMIVKNSNADVRKQIKLSWFDVPEIIEGDNTDSGVELSEGVLFFSRLISVNEKEVAI